MAEANKADGTGAGGGAAVLDLPRFAVRVIGALEADGYEAWVVGGCVRDALLGRACADVDVASSASWREAQRSFQARGIRTHETGTAHGTITAVADGHAVEVTTYRFDGAYAEDARHPERVTFVRSVEEDLARRDFTMNAMAYHPARGLLDPFGGRADLEAGVVRAVGDPAQRFSEDALRILRACRFAAQLGFRIEEATLSGMLANKGLLPRISAERVTHELDRLLTGPFAGSALLECVDALAAVLPELMAMKGFEQRTPYHIYDVLEHTARVIDAAPASPLVRWAALLHDMGKPGMFFVDGRGVGHFYGHALLSVQMARGVMARLALSSAFRTRVLELVRRHDDDLFPTPKSVRRMLASLEGDVELFRALCDLKRADAAGQAPRCRGRIAEIDEVEAVLDRVLASDDAFTLKRLAVDGRDAMELGVPEGPLVGEALKAALAATVDGVVANERGALKAFLTGWLAERVDEARG
ncbi:CCA tRNA nucleotidyltransferase [Arabiibacter massiliensis]|uniref:CCA tRNA nucleotidyltransferase n=1 Tax=Arabiibacter massiliensis TaxID=1870985 RepID=UPI0009B964F0|nr:HD domain-containing protein [Arabiibacter massiliensis]